MEKVNISDRNNIEYIELTMNSSFLPQAVNFVSSKQLIPSHNYVFIKYGAGKNFDLFISDLACLYGLKDQSISINVYNLNQSTNENPFPGRYKNLNNVRKYFLNQSQIMKIGESPNEINIYSLDSSFDVSNLTEFENHMLSMRDCDYFMLLLANVNSVKEIKKIQKDMALMEIQLAGMIHLQNKNDKKKKWWGGWK